MLVSNLLLILSAFILVALRAFQSQNVVHGYYWWAAVTSYALAFGEIALILYVVQQGWSSAIFVGTGGALGVTFAMFVHRRYIHNKSRSS